MPNIPRLPPIDDSAVPAAGVLRRAVSLTLITMLLGVATLIGAAGLVTVHETVDAVGSLDPIRVWPVRARTSGTISDVLVRSGDTVVAGQPVAELDTLDLGAKIAQTEAQIASQRLDLKRARAMTTVDQRRVEGAAVSAAASRLRARAALRSRLADLGLAAANIDSLLRAHHAGIHVGIDAGVADVMTAEGEVAAADAQSTQVTLAPLQIERQRVELQRLETQLREQRVLRARSVVRSPAAGVILSEQIERLPGTLTREGDALLDVADVTAWIAAVTVRDRDVYRVHVGDPAVVSIAAIGSVRNEPLAARVLDVAAEPATAPAGATGASVSSLVPSGTGPPSYRITLAIDRAVGDSIRAGVLRRGYVANAKIITRSATGWVLLRDWIRNQLNGRTG